MLIGFVSRDVHDHGFGGLPKLLAQIGMRWRLPLPSPRSPFLRDASWVTLTFRCLGEGSSGLIIAYSHGYYEDYGHEFNFHRKTLGLTSTLLRRLTEQSTASTRLRCFHRGWR